MRIANDVEAAAGAEIELGAGRKLPSFLAVWWGTGVGGSVVLDGKRWHGRGAAGEVGHMVIRMGGRRCPCGRHGCVEAYAGRAAMEERARRLHEHGQKTKLFELMDAAKRDRLTSSIWQKALEHDDPLARELIADAYEALAAVSASVLNLLDLDGVDPRRRPRHPVRQRRRGSHPAARWSSTCSTPSATRRSCLQSSATTAARSARRLLVEVEGIRSPPVALSDRRRTENRRSRDDG